MRRVLARLIADPDQPVCAAPEDDSCGRVHVDPATLAMPAVVATVRVAQLPPAERERYRGPHAHARIVIYRDHLDHEWAVWRDGDPTKDGAWDIVEDVDLEEAWRLVAARDEEAEMARLGLTQI